MFGGFKTYIKKHRKRREKMKNTIIWVGALAHDVNGKFLFLKRSKNNKSGVGRWQLPGGKLEWKEGLLQALKREVKEETSGRIEKPKLFGVHDVVRGRGENSAHIVMIVYEGKFKGKVKVSEEHDEFEWLTMKDAMRKPLSLNLSGFLSATRK